MPVFKTTRAYKSRKRGESAPVNIPTPAALKRSARQTGRVCKVCGKFDTDPHNSLKDMCKSCHGKLARRNKSAEKPLKKQELSARIARWAQRWEGFMAQW